MKTINDIIPDLIDLTQRDKLQWLEMPSFNVSAIGGKAAGRDGYKASILSEFDVEVSSPYDSAIDGPVIVVTLKKDRKEIDRTTGDRFAANHPTLVRLHDAARRKASNVDTSIDQVLKLLAGMKR
jgi:hypothetical protein